MIAKKLSLTLGILALTTSCTATSNSSNQNQQLQLNTVSDSRTVSSIKIDGSSTVYPITDEIAKSYQISETNKPQVPVAISGTGGGFKKFCAGETDINNASRPILTEEMEACKAASVQYIELPIAYDALTVVVHPQNNWAKDITVAELKKVWEPAAEGKTTRWNQIRASWPNQPFKLYGPGEDSGTFDYFTEAIIGKAKASRNDYTASEDDVVLVQE